MNEREWEAAEFLVEWDHEGLRYKALSVPREAIDEDSDEDYPALMIIGIDSGGVRRVDELFDPAYGRMGREEKESICEILSHAPKEIKYFFGGEY